MPVHHLFGSLLEVIQTDDAYVSDLGYSVAPLIRYIHRAATFRNAQRTTDKWKHSLIQSNVLLHLPL